MTEILFFVEDNLEDGYTAKAYNEPIFTQASDIEILHEMIRDAVHCHFPFKESRPKIICLHIVGDEVVTSYNYCLLDY